jgi:hypothetical protein
MGHRIREAIPPILPGLLSALALVIAPGPGRAMEPQRPAPPPAPIRYFDSDLQACRPEAIRDAYRAHLLPYADQPPAVLARLRRVQDDMTLASLKRCVQKGLLTRPEASELFRGLGLTLPGTPIAPASQIQPATSTPADASGDGADQPPARPASTRP